MVIRASGKRRSRLGAAAAMAALALTAAACSSSSKPSGTSATSTGSSGTGSSATSSGGTGGNKTVTVTLIGQFEGTFASSSQGQQNGFNYAFDQINSGKGPFSIPGVTLKLNVVDDHGDSSQALQAARSASSAGNKILFLIAAADIQAVQPAVGNGQMITFDTSPPAVNNDPKKMPYNFNFFPPNAAGIAAELKDAAGRHLSKFALVTDTTGQFQDYVDALNQEVSTDDPGAKVVMSQKFDPATKDFSSIATKIRQSGADSIWFFSAGPAVQAFFQGLIAANINAPIYNGYGSLTCVACYTFPAAFLHRVYLPIESVGVLGPDGQPLFPKYGEVQQGLWQKYGKGFTAGVPTNVEVGYGIAWAVKQAGGADPAKMKAALEGTKAAGGVSFIDPQIKYAWSPTYHQGYPEDQIKVALFGYNPTWPLWYSQAPAA